MKVLKIEPNKKPIIIDLDCSLSSLQQVVSGYIEAIYPFRDDVAIICNEEAKMLNLPFNRALRDTNDNVYDIICGTFLVVGLTSDNFGGLSEDLIQKYSNYYNRIESFVIIGHRIIAI